MKQIFEPKDFFTIPDNTLIAPFLNSKDSTSNLPFDLIDGFSAALGLVKQQTESLIHFHPHVVQVNYIISGKVNLKMKGTTDSYPYEIELKQGQAAIVQKNEFFQLKNPFAEDCQILYLVSPAYLFELSKSGEVIYDDAIVLNENWQELESQNWNLNKFKSNRSLAARKRSLERLKKNK